MNGDVSPIMVTVFGLSAVFIALFALVGLLTLMGRILGGTGKTKSPAPAAAAKVATDSPTEPKKDDTEHLRRIAIAAFALHQSRRATVRGPRLGSEWGIAARVQSTNRN